MDSTTFENLLQGLPATEWRVIQACRRLDNQSRADEAQRLLERALHKGASDLVRLELARHLIYHDQPRWGLEHLDLTTDPNLSTPSLLLSARATIDLGDEEGSRKLVETAAAELDSQTIAAWTAHIFNGATRPPLPAFPDPLDDEKTIPAALLADQEITDPMVGRESQEITDPVLNRLRPSQQRLSEERTHVVDLGDDLETNPQHESPREQTHLIDVVNQSSPDEMLEERTHLFHHDSTSGVISSADLIESEEPLRDLRPTHQDREGASQTLPPTTTEAADSVVVSSGDLRSSTYHTISGGYETLDEPEVDGDSSSDSRPPNSGISELRASGNYHQLEPVLSGATPDLTVRKGDRSPAHLTPDSPREAQESVGFVRQMTTYVSEHAGTRIEELRNSPATAIFFSSLTALLVFTVGLASIYSYLAHSHLDRQLERVERSIAADLYSSHLAALRDARELAEYQVIPWEPLDEVIGAGVDRLPLLSASEKRRRVNSIATYVEARLDYRFATPGVHLDRDLSVGQSPLEDAAEAYRRLGLGDPRGALRLFEASPAEPYDDWLVTLAWLDALTAGGTNDEIHHAREILTPPSNAATAFATAGIFGRIDHDAASIEELLLPFVETELPHIGALLKLAHHSPEASGSREFIDQLRDPNHPHASSVDRARAHLVTAHHTSSDEDEQLNHLERAALAAPLRADVVRALTDELLRRGDLAQAQSWLARTPRAEPRHPFFDLEMARIHLLSYNLTDAMDRLDRHPDNGLALVTQVILLARQGDRDQASLLLERLRQLDPELASIATAWFEAIQGAEVERSPSTVASQRAEESPILVALLAEIYRVQASHPDASEAMQKKRHREAKETLDSALLASPELRRQTCLLALASDLYEGRSHPCQELVRRDLRIPFSLPAGINWYGAQSDYDGAQELLEKHRDKAGSSLVADLLAIRVELFQDTTSVAQNSMQELPSRARIEADYQVLEALVSIRGGAPDRGLRKLHGAREITSYSRVLESLSDREVQLLLDDIDDAEQDAQSQANEIRELLAGRYSG